jgi:putative ABC transport system permease protein
MRLLLLSLRMLWARRRWAGLSLLLMAAGLACLVLVLQAGRQIHQGLARSLAQVDVVAGAKGSSPEQLVMGNLLQMMPPSGDILMAQVQALQQDSRFAKVVPLVVRDNFIGYRVLGTSPDYLALYGASFAEGQVWQRNMQAVMGAEVARDSGAHLNNTFVITHGMDAAGGDKHKQAPLRVVGILAPCACVLDRSVLTSLSTVWYVHDDSMTEEDLEQSNPKADARRGATAALLQYAPGQQVAADAPLPSSVGELQAALVKPALRQWQGQQLAGVNRLVHEVGLGLLLLGGLVWFAVAWSAARAHQADYVMLRWLGASPAKLAGLLLCQALALAALATGLGVLGGHVALYELDPLLQARHFMPLDAWQWQQAEWLALALALVVSLLAAAVPAWRAGRVAAQDVLLPPTV